MDTYNTIDLNTIDRKLSIEILKAYKKIIKKYPKLKNTISLITDINTLLNELNIDYSNAVIVNTNNLTTTKFLTTATVEKTKVEVNNQIKSILLNKPDFIGIGINGCFNKRKATKWIKQGYEENWFCARNIRDAFNHEIGHVFANLFRLLDNEVFVSRIELYKKKYTLSEYSNISLEEFVAECFCKYQYDSNYNNAVTFVGRTIDEYYNIFKNTNLFDIKRKNNSNCLKYCNK